MNPPDGYNPPEDKADVPGGAAPGETPPRRLIDELIEYLRYRQRPGAEAAQTPIDDERVLRTILHHLRRNPVPTALLGASLTWLLLAGGRKKEEEPGESQLGRQLEQEILEQVKGGYAYTNQRLRDFVDRYPWAAAGTIVGGGLLASLFIPERKRRLSHTYVEPGVDVDDTDLDRPL